MNTPLLSSADPLRAPFADGEGLLCPLPTWDAPYADAAGAPVLPDFCPQFLITIAPSADTTQSDLAHVLDLRKKSSI